MIRFVLNEEPNWVRPGLLLHPPIPWPLWGVNPRRLKGRQWWDVTRKVAFEANNQCCWACGTHRLDVEGSRKYLEGHETYDINYDTYISTYLGTVGLCPLCHTYIHIANPKRLMFERAQKRGDALLAAAGLVKEPIRKMLSVGHPTKWRMSFEGELHAGILGGYDEAISESSPNSC